MFVLFGWVLSCTGTVKMMTSPMEETSDALLQGDYYRYESKVFCEARIHY